MLKFSSVVLLLITSCTLTFGQTETDFSYINSLAIKDINIRKVAKPVKVTKVDNEIDLSLKVLYLFYKNFLSSQDANKCAFHPSCSDYSVKTIGKQGLVKGTIMAFDRLIRCNGLSPEKYNFDLKKRKMIDLVE